MKKETIQLFQTNLTNCEDCNHCTARHFRMETVYKCRLCGMRLITTSSIDNKDEDDVYCEVSPPEWCPLKSSHGRSKKN